MELVIFFGVISAVGLAAIFYFISPSGKKWLREN